MGAKCLRNQHGQWSFSQHSQWSPQTCGLAHWCFSPCQKWVLWCRRICILLTKITFLHGEKKRKEDENFKTMLNYYFIYTFWISSYFAKSVMTKTKPTKKGLLAHSFVVVLSTNNWVVSVICISKGLPYQALQRVRFTWVILPDAFRQSGQR